MKYIRAWISQDRSTYVEFPIDEDVEQELKDGRRIESIAMDMAFEQGDWDINEEWVERYEEFEE